LAKCFGSSEPSSGHFSTYRHGAVNEFAHYGIWYCLQTILILKFKLKYTRLLNAPLPWRWFTRTETCWKLRINDYKYIVFDWIIYFIVLVLPGTLSWNRFVACMKECIVWHEMIHGKYRQNNGVDISYSIQGRNSFQLQLGTLSCCAISIQILSQISWQHTVAVVAVGTRTKKQKTWSSTCAFLGRILQSYNKLITLREFKSRWLLSKKNGCHLKS